MEATEHTTKNAEENEKTQQLSVKEAQKIQALIADTILQDDTVEVNIKTIGTIRIAHPSTATLIHASKLIGKLPQMPRLSSDSEALYYTLAHAANCNVLGDIAALLLLGRNNFNKKVCIYSKPQPRTKWGKALRWFEKWTKKKVYLRTIIAKRLLEDFTPEQLHHIIGDCLGNQGIGFFLSTIISLNEANLLKQTTNSTTASGQ